MKKAKNANSIWSMFKNMILFRKPIRNSVSSGQMLSQEPSTTRKQASANQALKSASSSKKIVAEHTGSEIPKAKRSGRPNKYPFKTMKPGDSFFVADRYVLSMRQCMVIENKRCEYAFKSRRVDGGCRVWCVEK